MKTEYTVRSRQTGEILAEGGSAACAAKLGVKLSTFHSYMLKPSKKYIIDAREIGKTIHYEDLELCRRYTEAANTLRREFGLPPLEEKYEEK